jgi:hypothetical protein
MDQPITPKQRLLLLARKRVGLAELAKRMAVPEGLLEAWMTGQATMPDARLLSLADVIEQLEAGANGL